MIAASLRPRSCQKKWPSGILWALISYLNYYLCSFWAEWISWNAIYYSARLVNVIRCRQITCVSWVTDHGDCVHLVQYSLSVVQVIALILSCADAAVIHTFESDLLLLLIISTVSLPEHCIIGIVQYILSGVNWAECSWFILIQVINCEPSTSFMPEILVSSSFRDRES